MTIEVMKQARQIIWRYRHETPLGNQPHMISHEADETLERIDQAIAEAEKQDKFCDDNCVWTDHHKDCVRASVSWKYMAFARLGVVRDKMHQDDIETVQRFLDGDYTHPQPKREWVGLTNEDIEEAYKQAEKKEPYMGAITRKGIAEAFEQILKEKNA